MNDNWNKMLCDAIVAVSITIIAVMLYGIAGRFM